MLLSTLPLNPQLRHPKQIAHQESFKHARCPHPLVVFSCQRRACSMETSAKAVSNKLLASSVLSMDADLVPKARAQDMHARFLSLQSISLPLVTLCTLAMLLAFRRKSNNNLPPGPMNWPIVGSLFTLRQPLQHCFARLAGRYGPVFYLEMGMVPTVVVSNAEMASQVLKVHDPEFAYRPDMTFFKCVSYSYNDLAFSPDGDTFRRMRKVCSSHMFSSSQLNLSSSIRCDELRACVRRTASSSSSSTADGEALLNRVVNRVVNLTTLFHETASNSSFLMVFGEKHYSSEKNETSFLRALIADMEEEFTKMNIGDIFPLLRPLDLQRKKARWEKELIPPLRSFMEQKLEEHRKNKRVVEETTGAFQARCLIDMLISLDGDEDALPDIQMIGLLTNVLFGGITTQESTLDWAFAELVRHPDVMAKAHQELDRVVGKDRFVDESDLPNLPYLDAIVKETLRLHAPLPLAAPHFNPVESQIGPYTIPAKSTVFISIFAIGRDPETWKAPEEFNPDRFMGSNISVAGQHSKYIPFSAGRRICPGYPFAMRYTPLFIATFLQAFEWSPAPGCSIADIDMSEKLTGMCVRAKDLLVSAQPRLPAKFYSTAM